MATKVTCDLCGANASGRAWLEVNMPMALGLRGVRTDLCDDCAKRIVQCWDAVLFPGQPSSVVAFLKKLVEPFLPKGEER